MTENENQLKQTVEQEAQPLPSRSKKGCVFIIIIAVLVLSILFLSITTEIFNFSLHRRVRNTEGLVLASAAKNLVTDNAVNGFPLDHGWTPVTSTKSTRSILIDEVSGVITIVGDPANGGVVLVLTPTENDGVRLVSGKEVQGRITWTCKTLSLGNASVNEVPAECR